MNAAGDCYGTDLAFNLSQIHRLHSSGQPRFKEGIKMTSKGPVDFFLGVFLEFGAALCLLFFLPQIPWHWLPQESGSTTTSVRSPTPLEGFAATERRVSLFTPQAVIARTAHSPLVPDRREAPALLPAETQPDVAPAASSPLASDQPPAAPTSFYRRELPRQYRY